MRLEANGKVAKAVSPEIAIISTDTSIDKDSANKRVKQLFDKSQVYITQDFNTGITISIKKDGSIELL